jgi:hypothetical protein
MAERWLAGDKPSLAELIRTEQRHPATALETAAEYFDAGRWRDGCRVDKGARARLSAWGLARQAFAAGLLLRRGIQLSAWGMR